MAITGCKRLKVLRFSPHAQANERLRCGLCLPFQAASCTAGLFIGHGLVNAPAGDWAAGTDVILFDSLDALCEDAAMPITRNHEEINPLNGEPSIFLKFNVAGGFVPLGAKREDGMPHPHAGTGFGLSLARSYPKSAMGKDRGDGRVWGWRNVGKLYDFFDLHQFGYDGETFSVTRTDRFDLDALLPGWQLLNRPLRNAIPDGDDLLFGMQGRKAGADDEPLGSGLTRWQYGEQGWRPVSFVPVTQGIRAFEPTVIRDTDGSLLYCVRPLWGEEQIRSDVMVWRSADNGATWEQVIHTPGVRCGVPVTINQAADLTPFIAGSLYTGPLAVNPPWKMQPGLNREILCLWPLNEERTATGTPLFAACPRFEFGPAPKETTWFADHPVCQTVQLKDGCHALLAYRLGSGAEGYLGEDPRPESGCHINEVLSDGEPVAPWRF